MYLCKYARKYVLHCIRFLVYSTSYFRDVTHFPISTMNEWTKRSDYYYYYYYYYDNSSNNNATAAAAAVAADNDNDDDNNGDDDDVDDDDDSKMRLMTLTTTLSIRLPTTAILVITLFSVD